jgi:hypothetical protein
MEPIMADDGSGADISIPSFLIFKEDADPIKQVLKNNTQVRVEMKFAVPNPGSRVEWDLWTHPREQISRQFLSEFKSAVAAIGKGASFTPHMYVYDGSAAGCVTNNGDNQCYNLCTNNGRYCAVDPDDDFQKGLSGADIVTESLRSLCVWEEYGKDDGLGIPWWNYVKEFMARCDNPQQADQFKSSDCIKLAMKIAGVDYEKVEACMKSSGGLSGNGTNSIFERQLQNKETQGVFLIPSVYVNSAPVRGELEFATIFKAVCAGFTSGTEPDICTKCSNCINEKQCVDQGGLCTTAGTGAGSTSGTVSAKTFALALAGLSTFFVVVAYILYERQQRLMREQVRGIMAEYMPLGGRNRGPMDTSLGIEEPSDADHDNGGDLHLTIT